MGETYMEKIEHVGDLNQLLTLKEAVLTGGFQKGVQVMEVANGGNLAVTILPGRCMDMYQVRYKGKSMNYISQTGIVAPEFYDAQGENWLRNFFAGMMTTCGLQHFGAPLVVDGVERGMHGRITNTPAENVKYTRGISGENPTLTIEGTMREAAFFGENLSLHRKYEFEYENDSIVITDTITNLGFGERPFVYAMHLNYGYPLLEKGTKLFIDSESMEPRAEFEAQHMDSWQEVTEAQYPYQDRCYFHKMKKDENGMAEYTIFNEKRGIGVNVHYNADDLPYFVQWKMLSKGEYVMGLEPMNSDMYGAKLGQEGCPAPVLGPRESKTYKATLRFIDKL